MTTSHRDGTSPSHTHRRVSTTRLIAGLAVPLFATLFFATRATVTSPARSTPPSRALTIVQRDTGTAVGATHALPAPAQTIVSSTASPIASPPTSHTERLTRASVIRPVARLDASMAPVPVATPAIHEPRQSVVAIGSSSTTGGVVPVVVPVVVPNTGRLSDLALLRASLARAGVQWESSLTSDVSRGSDMFAATGAARTHVAIALVVDFDSLASWRGLSGYAQYKAKSGRNGSGAALMMQNYSNIDADDFRRFGEVWLEQRLWQDKVRVRAGRLDFNSEFAGTHAGANFLNASMGFTPTIAAAPTYPLPAAGMLLVVSPVGGLQLSAAGFDGRDGAPAPVGGVSRFAIGQIRQQWSSDGRHPGTLSLGAWRHSGLFEALSGDDVGEIATPGISGVHGAYATVEQALWSPGAAASETSLPGLDGFAQLGIGDSRVGGVQQHVGGGMVLRGFLNARATDVVGLATTAARWDGGRESVHELFYSAHLHEQLQLVGDLQRVQQRQGGPMRRAGTVFTLRWVVSL